MPAADSIQVPLTNDVIRQNVATEVERTSGGLIIHLKPRQQTMYQRPDCIQPVRVHPHITEMVTVQGLGLPGQPVRYEAHVVRVWYINDAGVKCTFTLPMPGLRLKLGLTDAAVDKTLYFVVDCNLSLEETVKVMKDVYGVETSKSALDRIKQDEAEKLPGQGEIIRRMNAKKKVTSLHIDEYKAKGKKGWELIVRDNHGRLLLSVYLRKRSKKRLQIILRWLRMLGIEAEVCYIDGWAGYLPAIRAIYPQAKIQYDYFHIIQNIWRHLHKEFTRYRRRFKQKMKDKEIRQLFDKIHKRLWDNRYLFFTREDNLNDETKVILDELLAEHDGTVLVAIVAFTRRIWDLFNNSPTKLAAHIKRLDLIAEGWAEKSEYFRKSMNFLNEHFQQMITFIDDEQVQRNSLAETTVRMVRRIETVRQGFKTVRGRANHFKLFQHRSYLAPAS